MLSCRYTILLLTVCLPLQYALGKQSKIDSLKTALSYSKKDTNKVHLLHILAKEEANINPDSAILIAQSALELSYALSYNKGIIESKEVLGITFHKAGEGNKADTIFKQLETEAIQSGDSTLLATAFFRQGALADDLGKPYQALVLLEKALVIRKTQGDSLGIADVLNNLGNVYAYVGNYSQALDMYQQALFIDLELNNIEGISTRYNNIARIYSFKNDNEKALEYFKKSYDMALKTDDSSKQRIRTNNIGYVLKQQGNFKEALHYLFLSLQIRKALKERCGGQYPLYNIGSIYEKMDVLDSATYYLEQAISSAEQCNDAYIICLAYIDLGKVSQKLNEHDRAGNLFLTAFQKADKSGLKAEKKDAAKLLSEMYEQQRNTDKALYYFKIYNATKDSIFNEEASSKIARLEAESEFRQQAREEEISRQLEELEREKALARAIWLRNSFTAGFIIMAVIAFLIYRNYHRKNKANQLLNVLNLKIQAQKDELTAQTEELKNANEEITIINENLEQIVHERTRTITEQNKKILEYVFYNSHQVRGPLARILGLVSLFKKKALSTKEFKEKLNELNNEAQELDKMVRNMNRTLEKEKKSIRYTR